MDPPYYGTERFYDIEPGTFDHQRLKDALAETKGRWLLSYNDCEYIRALYADYNIATVERNNNLLKKSGDPYKELIITNYR